MGKHGTLAEPARDPAKHASQEATDHRESVWPRVSQDLERIFGRRITALRVVPPAQPSAPTLSESRQNQYRNFL
jgi:hypothetical protein